MRTHTILLLLSFFFIVPAGFAQPEEEEKTMMLDTVVIRKKAPDKETHVATQYISRKDIQSSNPRDVGEYLRSIPNVSGIRRGGSALDPVVRGFRYSQLNVILNNGVKIENGCPNRMDPVSSHIEAEDIEKIEVIKGPFSLKHGPAFGGVINLVSPYPEPSEKFEIHGSILAGIESNWNGKKSHGTLHGGNDKVFFFLSGGYRDYGNYKSGSREGKTITYSSAMRKHNYVAKLGFSLTPDQRIIFSYDGVHGRQVMYPALPMDEKSDDTHMSAIDYSLKDLSPLLKSLDIKVYRSVVAHVMDNSNRPSYATMQMVADVDAVNTGGNINLSWQSARYTLLLGADIENIEKDGKRTGTMSMMGTTSTKVTNLWNDALIRNMGLFADYKTFFPLWEVAASVRGDFNTATSADTLTVIKNGVNYFGDVHSSHFNLSASLGITKFFNRWSQISLAFGRGTRSPNMLERYIKLLPVGYDQYDYLGNPQLKPETNNEIDLTFRIDRENEGNLYLNFFYSYVQNFITANLLSPSIITPQSQGVVGVKQFCNAHHIINKGFEFGYRSPERYKLGGKFTAAYTHGTVPSVNQYIITDSEVTGAVEIKNDALPEIPPLETSMNIYYAFWNSRVLPAVTVRAVAGQRHVSKAFYETENPGFWILNFSLTCKVDRYVELNTGVNNVFDRAYYEHLNRRIIGTNQNLYEPGRVFYATMRLNF